MSDELNKIDELKKELEALQADPEITGKARLEKTQELVKQIEDARAEEVAAEAAQAALAESVEAEQAEEPVADADESDDADDKATGGDPEEAASEEPEAEEAKDADAESTEEVEADAAADSEEDQEQSDATAEDVNNDATEEVSEKQEGETVSENEKAEALAAAQTVDQPTGKSESKIRIVAAVTGEGFSAGQEMRPEDFARAHKMSVDNSRSGQSGRYIVASIEREVGPAVSAQHGADENARIMRNAAQTQHTSITAASFCGPDEAVKEIRTCGEDARPVADLFGKVSVSGRFNYTKDLGIADVAAGTQIWESADQDLVDTEDPLTHKPCVSLDCAAEVSVDPYAIPVCGRYSVHQNLSHPERVDAFMRKLSIATARTAERQLLDRLRAQSRILTHSVAGQGLFNNAVNIIGQLGGPLSYGERLGEKDWVALLPVGLLRALTLDVIQSGSRTYDDPAQYVQDALRDLGISRIVPIHEVDTDNTTHYDAASAALPAEGVETAWDPATMAIQIHKMYLLDPSDFVMGQTEVVSAGTIQDRDLVKTNQVEWFTESMEFLEKTGCGESVVLELDACPTGVASGNDVAGIACPV